MVVAVRPSPSTTTYASRTNTVLTAPTGLANNDILLCALFDGASGAAPAVTPPTGFTLVGTATSVNDTAFFAKFSLYWKRAASESGSYTFTHSAASSQGVMLAISGAATSGSPIDVFSSNSGAGTTSTATGVTTPTANDLLLYLGHDWTGGGALNPPTGMTEVFDNLVYAASLALGAAGATGNKTQTNGNGAGNPWAAWLVAIAPASGAAPTGSLSVTETADTASLSGNAGTSGALSSTEGTDTASLAANAGTSGTLATTEATDTASLSGSFSIIGALSTTEATDTASISGGFKIVGSLSVTESPDVASFTAPGIVSGALAATDNADIAGLSGNTGVSGALSTTDAADTAAFASGNLGTLTATETADTASFGGNFNISASFAITGSPDIAAFSSLGNLTGVLGAFENADIATLTGAAIPPNYNPLGRLNMYTGTLGAMSNREDWIVNIAFTDDEGSAFDISAAQSIGVYICRQGCPNDPVLSATLGSGILLIDDFTIQWAFTENDMQRLHPSQYDVFCRVEISNITTQVLSASVAIVEGGPRQ